MFICLNLSCSELPSAVTYVFNCSLVFHFAENVYIQIVRISFPHLTNVQVKQISNSAIILFIKNMLNRILILRLLLETYKVIDLWEMNKTFNSYSDNMVCQPGYVKVGFGSMNEVTVVLFAKYFRKLLVYCHVVHEQMHFRYSSMIWAVFIKWKYFRILFRQIVWKRCKHTFLFFMWYLSRWQSWMVIKLLSMWVKQFFL